jgi:hypothetical protein
VTATSTYASKGDQYAAWRTVSFDAPLDQATHLEVPTTAWCEGKPDEGIGEGITIALGGPTQLDSIQIAAGVWKTAKLFAANNKISALDVVLDGKVTQVRPAAQRAWLEVPVGRAVSTIALKIAAVDKGAMNDTCISGVSLQRAKSVPLVVLGVDQAALDALPRGLASIEAALDAGGPSLQKLLDFPFSFRPVSYSETNAKAVIYKTWAPIEAACRAEETAEAKLTRCPGPTIVDDGETRVPRMRAPAPATVEIAFPNHSEQQEAWRVHWHDGAWHLAAISYVD